jgi:glycosyltransferase involved in cell wall biosynthesis
VTEIHTKLDKLAKAVGETRALAGAVYERIEEGPMKLARARGSERWRLAYSESEPLVTVRIATHNRAELLVERALASVRRQTYSNWEAVVVGDHCTDATEERVTALGDPRIRFRNLPVREPYPEDRVQRWMIAGVPAMNAGLRMARGSWIAPLDDDDEWDDDHIETLLAAVREQGAEFAYGRARCCLGGAPIDRSFGAWPPRQGGIGLLACLYNGALTCFEHDMACRFMDEVNDWNLVRRMWEAGVKFTFVDRMVATYHADHMAAIFKEPRS